MKHEIKAPCAGTVWMQVAAVGQTVEAGGQVLVCESMKMEIPIETPVSGTVTFLADAATNIVEGDVIAVVEFTG